MIKNILLGAIIGDMCGSSYELTPFRPKSTKDDIILMTEESRFTDDTVCTIAIADAILKDVEDPDFESSLLKWCRRYPKAGYGRMFLEWFMSSEKERIRPTSYGNGSAMRVSPCGWLINYENLAYKSAIPTHSHPEGIKGAQAIADCIHEATECVFQDMIAGVADIYYPNFDFEIPISELRVDYKFNATCQESVPHAISCFLQSNSYEDCIKNAIWLGGDTDTIAAMAGSIAMAYYENMPEYLVNKARKRLPAEMLEIVDAFDIFVAEHYE